jgi:hypothetical protein
MHICSCNNFSYRLRNMPRICPLPSSFIALIDQIHVDDIDVAISRKKSLSSTTYTTTTTNASATSLDLYSQVGKVIFPLSRYLLNDPPLHMRQKMFRIRSTPFMGIEPSTFVDEKQVDGGARQSLNGNICGFFNRCRQCSTQ